MCPFSVRADVCCARSFSWKPALSFSVLAEAFRMHRAFPLCAPDFPGAQVSRLPQLFPVSYTHLTRRLTAADDTVTFGV